MSSFVNDSLEKKKKKTPLKRQQLENDIRRQNDKEKRKLREIDNIVKATA